MQALGSNVFSYGYVRVPPFEQALNHWLFDASVKSEYEFVPPDSPVAYARSR